MNLFNNKTRFIARPGRVVNNDKRYRSVLACVTCAIIGFCSSSIAGIAQNDHGQAMQVNASDLSAMLPAAKVDRAVMAAQDQRTGLLPEPATSDYMKVLMQPKFAESTYKSTDTDLYAVKCGTLKVKSDAEALLTAVQKKTPAASLEFDKNGNYYHVLAATNVNSRKANNMIDAYKHISVYSCYKEKLNIDFAQK